MVALTQANSALPFDYVTPESAFGRIQNHYNLSFRHSNREKQAKVGMVNAKD